MREKFLWIGIILIVISGIANYIYFESEQLSEPVFIDHYIKKSFNPHENHITFYYLTNKRDPAMVSYVEVDGTRFYPVSTGSGFMIFNSNRSYIPHEQEFSYYYLMRERINFPADMIPIKNAENDDWSFSAMEVVFTNGRHITAEIGKVIMSPQEPVKKVLAARMTGSSNQHIDQTALVAMEPITIKEIEIPFPEIYDQVFIKVDVEQKRLEELEKIRSGGEIPEWVTDNKKWKDYQGKVLGESILPLTLQKQGWVQLLVAMNHKSHFEFEIDIRGTDRTGTSFVHPIMIQDRPTLTQEDVEEIIELKAGENDDA